ncbi:ABC transporter permease [Paenibacillus medicaginis]|uniref:ABC transporter permease n=1 Tax=Paenibacillus medicaginis TaxID=1470560 RepID=A0ABV5C7J7_9BACL
MNLLETLKMSFSSLKSNKLRSLLTMLGIIIGVAAVIAIAAIGKGSNAQITSQINNMGNNLIMIYPFYQYDEANGTQFVEPPEFTLEDVAALEQLGSVADVAPSGTSSADVVWNRQKVNLQIEGTSASFASVQKLFFTAGRTFTNYEVEKGMNVAIIGSQAASDLFGENSANAVGETVLINNLPFKIVGLLSNKNSMMNNSANQIYIPITAGMERMSHMSIQQLNVSAAAPELMDSARAEITQKLRTRHMIKEGEPDDFQMMSQTDYLQMTTGVDSTMNLLIIGVAGIALLVGGVGIMNMMLMAVTERTREIGIRKAIGAQRGDIMLQFLMEAVFISLLGGILGVLGGIGAARLLNSMAQMPIVYTVEPVLYSFLSCMAVGILFGVIPALKASRLKPIDALRYE